MNKRQLKKFKKKLGYKSYKKVNAPISFPNFFNRYMEVYYDMSALKKAFNSFSNIADLFTPVTPNVYYQPVMLQEYKTEYKNDLTD